MSPTLSGTSSRDHFSLTAFWCSTALTVLFSGAFLFVGIHYFDDCCDTPLAAWNVAFGGMGIFIAFMSTVSVLLAVYKAEEVAAQNARDLEFAPSSGPKNETLTEMQQRAIAELFRKQAAERAREEALSSSPAILVVGAVQSVQGLYNVLMIAIGALLVWSTFPNDECSATLQAQGCDPFLWGWTEAWIITIAVLGTVLYCCFCCGLCLLAGVAVSAARFDEEEA